MACVEMLCKLCRAMQCNGRHCYDYFKSRGRLDLGRMADGSGWRGGEADLLLNQQIKQEQHCDSYQKRNLANAKKIVWRKLMSPQLEFCTGVQKHKCQDAENIGRHPGKNDMCHSRTEGPAWERVRVKCVGVGYQEIVLVLPGSSKGKILQG